MRRGVKRHLKKSLSRRASRLFQSLQHRLAGWLGLVAEARGFELFGDEIGARISFDRLDGAGRRLILDLPLAQPSEGRLGVP